MGRIRWLRSNAKPSHTLLFALFHLGSVVLLATSMPPIALQQCRAILLAVCGIAPLAWTIYVALASFIEAHGARERRVPCAPLLGLVSSCMASATLGVLLLAGAQEKQGIESRLKHARVLATMAEIDLALERYRTAYGRYPNELAEILKDGELMGSESVEWKRMHVLIDPWGTPLVYSCAGNSTVQYQLRSLGEDGMPSRDDLRVSRAFRPEWGVRVPPSGPVKSP